MMTALLAAGVREGVFPGAVSFWGDLAAERPYQAWAGWRGLTRERLPVAPDLVYDLASLTKILATANLVMKLHQEGRLELEAPLAEGPLARLAGPWPRRWAGLTAASLLAHQSGLPAWRPFYALPAEGREARRRAALSAILAEEPLTAPGRLTVYSDLGFLLLGFLVEEIHQVDLERAFAREVAEPLGLTALGYGLAERGGLALAPTEDGPRLGGPRDDPAAARFGATPLGRAHDDNAAWLSGRAGHAGLFGRAADLWAIMADWAAAWREDRGVLIRRRTLSLFLEPRPVERGPLRTLGFDLKSPDGLLAGTAFSDRTVGHLGYTGVSLWWDVPANFGWLLLTNRVHPTAANQAVLDFRRRCARLLKPSGQQCSL